MLNTFKYLLCNVLYDFFTSIITELTLSLDNISLVTSDC